MSPVGRRDKDNLTRRALWVYNKIVAHPSYVIASAAKQSQGREFEIASPAFARAGLAFGLLAMTSLGLTATFLSCTQFCVPNQEIPSFSEMILTNCLATMR